MSGEERRVGKRGEQKRAWDRTHLHLCVECGAKTARAETPSNAKVRCRPCAMRALRTHRDDAARLYNEGLSLREIAVRLDTTLNSVGATLTRARKEGLVGYRYKVGVDGKRVPA